MHNPLEQMAANLAAARAVVLQHGDPARIARLDRYATPPKFGTINHNVYASELLAGMAEIVEGLATP